MLRNCLALTAWFAVLAFALPARAQTPHKWAIVMHGGAGTITRSSDPGSEAAYRAALGKYLQVGADVLTMGGNSLDAVERVIALLEDDPSFNAGRGAVFT